MHADAPDGNALPDLIAVSMPGVLRIDAPRRIVGVGRGNPNLSPLLLKVKREISEERCPRQFIWREEVADDLDFQPL